jgi:arsenate reductase
LHGEGRSIDERAEARLALEAEMALPRALFVGIHNAGRSQMAQAFWEVMGGEGRSAGSNPGERIHPEVLEVMREVGLDLAGRSPRELTDDDAAWADVIVTMGCGDVCPHLPGRRYLEWDLPDPAGGSLDAARSIRDEIRRRIKDLAGGPA